MNINNQEKKILGTVAVILFLTTWELCGNILQLINPMFMSAPSFVFKAAYQMFASGEIYNDLYVSGIEFFTGYILSVVFAVLLGSPSVGISDSPISATHLLMP